MRGPWKPGTKGRQTYDKHNAGMGAGMTSMPTAAVRSSVNTYVSRNTDTTKIRMENSPLINIVHAHECWSSGPQ